MNMKNWKEFVSLIKSKGYKLDEDEDKVIKLLHLYKVAIGKI